MTENFWLQIASIAGSLILGAFGQHRWSKASTNRVRKNPGRNVTSGQDPQPQGGTDEKPERPAQETLL